MKNEWDLTWLDSNTCEHVHFKMKDEEGKVQMEFALKPPDHAKLYYALIDWFGDKK